MDIKYFSKNGKLLPLKDANVSLEDIAYQYGFGVYETLKVRNKIVYFVDEHIKRLMQSANTIGIEHKLTNKSIEKYIKEIVLKNKIENSNLKILLVGGKTKDESNLYIIPLAPLYPDKKLYSKGATTMSIQYERFLPNAKTLSMLPSYIYYTKAKKLGHYDVLYTDKKGNILEGSRTNFFAIKGKTIVTPPKAKVLEGVTRQTVIIAAKKNGFTVKEGDISIKDLGKYEGAFLTSTSSKIIPLVKVNSFEYKEVSGNLKELMKIYDNFLDDSKGIL